jgi:hypothetical protein
MLFLGIDPGGSGGLALISEKGKFVDFEPMPESTLELLAVVHGFTVRAAGASPALSPSGYGLRALLELVTPQPSRPGRPGWGALSTASFFRNIGHIEMALTACKVEYQELRAPAWQKIVGLAYPKGEPRNKNRSKALVAEIFPTLENVTHAAADALLLAEACRRIHRGGPNGT